ncbi:helix-turn-helix domain-containing protein [Enterococcus plantarum]|uniref:helix-turn-helix domain-containing protein n=1 Tax=Enterococcus plantarum TaxID=1077675 RepID=UPI001A8F4A25|nr:helix-turn-helix domain-containing protein [Enterococcus plantarum]
MNSYKKNIFQKWPDVVDVGQLCKMLKIGKHTAYNLLRNNEIYHIKIGRIYKIPKSSIIKYLLKNKL